MNERTQRLVNRNKSICEQFKALKNKKYKNTSSTLYSQNAILSMLGEQYGLSNKTIENIVFGRVTYVGIDK